MVMFRQSLEALVLYAWRERWTEHEWNINLKAAIQSENCGRDIDRLCALLLKQGTVSEEPNSLVFKYLSSTVSAGLVTDISFLDAVTTYNDLHKPKCIVAILNTFNLFKDRPKLDGLEIYQCVRFCELMRDLLSWFLDAIIYYVKNHVPDALSSFINNLFFFGRTFPSMCIYFDSLENPDKFQGITNKMTGVKKIFEENENVAWVTANDKAEFNRVSQQLLSLEGLVHSGLNARLSQHFTVSSYMNVDTPKATVICLAVLYGSSLLAERVEKIADSLSIMLNIQELEWPIVLRDFVRGSLLLQLDPCWPVPDSHMTAFAYLKVPRILFHMLDQEIITNEDVYDALVELAHYYSLFNALDARSRCDCFHHFLTELNKIDLVTKEDIAKLLDLRNHDKAPLPESSPGSQASVSLVLKAEPTLQTLLKSFHSEFAQKQDKLVQMMHHMISGKSFEFICAAAAATERLSMFAGKLVDFNEASKGSTTSSESEKQEDTVLRSELFDLSFLLLSRIVQLYTYRPIFSCSSNSECFFVTWCTSQLQSDQSLLSSSSSSPPCKVVAQPPLRTTTADTGSGMEYETESAEPPPCAKLDVDSAAAVVEDMYKKLKSGHGGWVHESLTDWSSICKQVPVIGEKLLAELKDDLVTAEECKNVFSGLLNVNVNGTHWMCSMLLCLVHWLIARPPGTTNGEERKKCALFLNNFVDAAVLPTTGERNKLSDRQTFMANVTKRLLSPLLAAEPVPSPSYPWLSSNSPTKTFKANSVGSYASMPAPDLFRQQFTSSLKQTWLPASALKIVAIYNSYEQQKCWIKICLEEFPKLSAVDDLNAWTDLCLACCFVSEDDSSYVSPVRKFPLDSAEQTIITNKCIFNSITTFVDLLTNFVFENGRDVFCVAPRGLILSRFMARLIIFGLITTDSVELNRSIQTTRWDSRMTTAGIDVQQPSTSKTVVEEMKEPESGGESSKRKDASPKGVVESDQPSPPKTRRTEEDKESSELSTTEAPSGPERWDPRSIIIAAIKTLFDKLLTACQGGNIRPSLLFSSSLLHYVSTRTCNESKIIRSLIPNELVNTILQTDPDVLPINSVLNLHDLNVKESRERALQNVFIIREMGIM